MPKSPHLSSTAASIKDTPPIHMVALFIQHTVRSYLTRQKGKRKKRQYSHPWDIGIANTRRYYEQTAQDSPYPTCQCSGLQNSITSHTSTFPHAPDNLLVFDDQAPFSEHSLQSFKDSLERGFGALFLREACDGQIGAAATVEDGVELGGEREGGYVESCTEELVRARQTHFAKMELS